MRKAPGADDAGVDLRIDAYIKRSAPFARPILTHLRAVVHGACPDCTETIKWGMPHFEYEGPLCMMAAFKAHAVFGFAKGSLITGPGGRSLEAMGSFGRLTSPKDLPAASVLTRYVKKAMALNVSKTKVERPRKHRTVATLRPPADLRAALAKHAQARATFEGFSPSARGEYIEWITSAKRPATRAERLATTITWLTEGKQRNWKYQKR